MKVIRRPIQTRLLGALALLTWLPLYGQGTFQNLGFESAQISNLPFPQWTWEPINQALPGWCGYLGSNEVTIVQHNSHPLDSAGLSIFGPTGWTTSIAHGKYAVMLQAGYDPFETVGGKVRAAIGQTAPIVSSDKALFYYATASLEVTFSGQMIPTYVMGQGPNGYSLWGGDVQAFAGQSGELRFTTGGPLGLTSSYLDFIRFSDQPIPEPSASGLFAAGALLLSWLRFRKQP